MFTQSDRSRNAFMLDGSFARKGYDWWWHSFTGVSRRTGKEKAFFIEYFLCNPALGGKEPIFGQLPENKKRRIRPSYLMVKAGCWGEKKKQLHRFFGWKQVRVEKGAPFLIQADDCIASDTYLQGCILVPEPVAKNHPEYMTDAGSMSWELRVEKEIPFHVGYGASAPLRQLKAFEMYWHAEGMKSVYSGTVEMDGEMFDILPEASYGYADKNWGSDFTSPWVWLSSNCLTSNLTGQSLNHSVFDIGGGRPKVYCFPLNRKLLGGFYYEGEEFEYNFSKIWQKPGTRFRFWEDDTYVYWKVWQENATSLMKVNARCKKADMLFVNYEAPNGKKRHNHLWNGGNGEGQIRLYRKTKKGLVLIDDIYASHMGCEYGEYDK